ncbi:hypothetical protein T12_3032 [Trichinella patagoniensis]|uniref:Uncharacterized protein n=1 Tax=Trichinella patagoniensis TaxID=990121 RepID=A0A0V0YR12_9BILA|nr:hypothetical protein T12_3032 [Trichinella patagoniensis]
MGTWKLYRPIQYITKRAKCLKKACFRKLQKQQRL